MSSLNKVMLIGNLGADPETRATEAGVSITNVNLATSERYKDRNGEQQERTEWHRLVFWDKKSELVQQYCKKGEKIYIEGQLQTRSWEDKEGVKRYTTEVKVNQIVFLGSKNGAANNDEGSVVERAAVTQDELPF